MTMLPQIRVSRRQAVLGGIATLGGLGLGGPARGALSQALAASRDDAPQQSDPALRDFAFRLFAQLTARGTASNVLISPLSVATALAMTYNGARAGTAQAMAHALGIGSMPAAQLNGLQAGLLRSLSGADPKVQLSIADSLWARQGVTLDPSFVIALRRYYGASAATLDFADPHAATAMNDWVRRQTHGKIDRIISGHIDPNAFLFLLNTVYFKGPWSSPFTPSVTQPGAFTRPGGARKSVPMMSQSLRASYYKGKGFEAIALPYGSGRLSMVVVLPAFSSSLAALQSILTAATWESWVARLQPAFGSISLPRFTTTYEVMPSLNPALSALGMGVAFDRQHADLSGIAAEPRPYISEVKHRALLEVSEEGTIGAAVTSVGVGATAVMAPAFNMVVDRPFLCAIRDSATGAILFLGSIVDPS